MSFLLLAGAGPVSSQGGGSSLDWGYPEEYAGLTPDYYISTTGSDSNDGLTPATAWSLAALNTVQRNGSSGIPASGKSYGGSVVGIIDGTYNFPAIFGSYDTGNSVYGDICVASGSAGNPTVIVSQTLNGAVLDYDRDNNDNALTEGGMFQSGSGGYMSLVGLHITRTNNNAIKNHTGAGGNVIIESCLFTDCQHIGNYGQGNPGTIYFEGVDDCQVRNCRFEECGDPFSDRHGHVYCYDTDGTIVEYCTAIGDATANSGPLVVLKDNGPENRNATIRYNYQLHVRNGTDVHDAFFFFWSQPAGTSRDIYNNVLVRTGSTGGVILYQASGQNNLGTLNFYNNTFVGPIAGGLTLVYQGAPNLGFERNIVAGNAAGPAGTYGHFDLNTISSLGTWDHNWYDSSPSLRWRYDTRTSTATGLAAWKSASGMDAGALDGTDASFVGTGSEAGQYQLAGGSPCLTMGPGGVEIGAWYDPSILGQTEQIGSSIT